jgi:excisionase family DNA binding protein
MRTHEKPSLREPLLTVNQTALLLGVSRSKVYALVRAGELVPLRVACRVRFAPDDLRAYLGGRGRERSKLS